jgi:hypothetical protein
MYLQKSKSQQKYLALVLFVLISLTAGAAFGFAANPQNPPGPSDQRAPQAASDQQLQSTDIAANNTGPDISSTSHELVSADKELKADWLQSKLDRFKEGFGKISYGVELTGFFDTTLANPANNPNYISAGVLELDFTRSLGKYFQGAAAVVYDPHGGTHLTVGFVDYHFFGGLIAPRGRIFVEKGFHLQAGRFDIPFGNDWQYFASKDRMTVTPPR